MKLGAKSRYSFTKAILPATIGVVFTAVQPSGAASDAIKLTPYEFGLSGYIFGHSDTAPFNLPDQLVSKSGLTAFDLGGQSSIPIRGIKGLYSISDLTVINGIGGPAEIKGDVAVGFELGSFAELSVFSKTAAHSLAEYGQDPVGGVVNLTTKTVPIGANLSGPDFRDPGTYRDFLPTFSKQGLPLRATWTYGASFTADAVGVVTEDSAFRVAEVGDSVPGRKTPPPVGTGSTWTEFDSFSLNLNGEYIAYKGVGDLFNGVYTHRFSDGERFAVAESFVLEPGNIGAVFGVFFQLDNKVIFGATGGIYRGDPEGAAPAELILENGTEYAPGKFFNSGQLHHVSDDEAAIVGSGENSLTTIWLLNLGDLSLEQMVQEDEEIPDGGGATFGFLGRPGVTPEMVVFEGFDQSFQFLGLYARMRDTWELTPVLRVGDVFDGREVGAVTYFPGALEGKSLGVTAYYTDGSHGAYLLTMAYDFSVPAVNISTRFSIGSEPGTEGIGGFINLEKPPSGKSGAPLASTKKVIIRAIGPSLSDRGVEGPLADPVLELHDSTGALLVSNDNWRDTQEQEIIDTTIPPSDDLEAAIVATLDPGPYTAVVRGKNGGTGIGLVEIYDLDGAATSELANISTRSLVQTGEDVMIGGIIITGESGTGTTVILRAIGPSLTSLGVPNALQDPLLELRDASGALITSKIGKRPSKARSKPPAWPLPMIGNPPCRQSFCPGLTQPLCAGRTTALGSG